MANRLDKQIESYQKKIKLHRLKAAYTTITNGYNGASSTKRSFRNWNVFPGGTADAKILYDLPLLRERANDLFRNNSVAKGAIRTTVNSVIGSGLQLQATLDRDFLGLSDEEAERIESTIERHWQNFWSSIEADATRHLTGPELEYLAFVTYLNDGECFAILPRFKRPGSDYYIHINLFEADRVGNPLGMSNTDTLRDGIELSGRGEPIKYYFKNQNTLWNINTDYIAVQAFGARTGRKNVLHIYKPESIGQSRGIPFVASIIEELKQLDNYTKHELANAAISSMFTGFIYSNRQDALNDPYADDPGAGMNTATQYEKDKDYTLAPGAIYHLDPDERIEFADPKRPNTGFQDFASAMLRQIGMALSIPYEMLTKEFNSSYTASKAARLEAWRFFSTERKWFASKFNQSIYEEFLIDLVLDGKIELPGFIEDLEIRKAYSSCQWLGELQGMLDPVREVQAAVMRIDNGLSTVAIETSNLGMDFEKNVRKIKRERILLDEAGLKPMQPELPFTDGPTQDALDYTEAQNNAKK